MREVSDLAVSLNIAGVGVGVGAELTSSFTYPKAEVSLKQLEKFARSFCLDSSACLGSLHTESNILASLNPLSPPARVDMS